MRSEATARSATVRASSKTKRPSLGAPAKKRVAKTTQPASTAAERPRRTERKRTERRQRILDVAAQVFAEKGYRDANLELIGARLDMRGPSIYHYFPTKEDLFAQCVEALSCEVFKRLDAIVENSAPAIDRLRALFREQVLSQLRDYYPQYIALTITIQLVEPVLRERLAETRAYHIGLFRRVAAEAAAAGQLPAGSWQLGLRLAFGALGFLHRWYRPDGQKSPEQLSEEIANALIRLLGGEIVRPRR